MCVLKITASDCTLKHITYFLRLGKLSKVLVRLQSIKFRKIHMIVGIETSDGMLEKPEAERVFRVGDIIWLVGEKEALSRLFVGKP